MTDLVRFTTDFGEGVVVEVEESDHEAGLVRASRRPGEVVLESTKSFGEIASVIQPVANRLIQSIRAVDVKPEEVEITFGLKLTFSAGAVIASTSGEGNFQIRLKWSS